MKRFVSHPLGTGLLTVFTFDLDLNTGAIVRHIYQVVSPPQIHGTALPGPDGLPFVRIATHGCIGLAGRRGRD